MKVEEKRQERRKRNELCYGVRMIEEEIVKYNKVTLRGLELFAYCSCFHAV